jgi:hypothetical protein
MPVTSNRLVGLGQYVGCPGRITGGLPPVRGSL